jgi:hypothetical protein
MVSEGTVAAGGFLGIGKKHFLIPIEEVEQPVNNDEAWHVGGYGVNVVQRVPVLVG